MSAFAKISVVIPIYNEGEGIPILYDRLTKSVSQIGIDYELIFVNDGSKDDSFAQIRRLAEKDPHVLYIQLSRNFGHQIAVSAGLEHTTGSAVVIIDGDLQDPPELIPEMYQKFLQGDEVVYAQRASRAGETLLKKATAKYFYRTLKRLTAIDIPLDTGDYRLMSRKVVNHLISMREQSKFIRGQVAWLGFRQSFVSFERQERQFGTTGYSYGKLIRLALDGITGFSDRPLIFVTRLGILVSSFAFIVILYALFSHFVLRHTITGWTSIIISTMFIGGIQLLSVGILGEYISRIHKNAQGRPLYIIEESNIEES
jgi:glycosyltransferase involved in cell wall biosynthesis